MQIQKGKGVYIVKKESDHLYFIDNIKIALIMLVVAHHAGQAYGPGGWWYFLDDKSINWLGIFFFVNASFFMSMFFFLSAYFLPQSIAKKGPKRFLKERLIRIGIPLLFGFLVMIPILMYLYYINFRDYEPISFPSYYVNIFFGLGSEPTNWSGPSWPDMQFGHLWFLEHLLVYAVVFSVWTYFTSKKPTKKLDGNIKVYQILSLLLIVSLVTFITRIWFPIDHWSAFLGVIQTEFAHVPQYVSFFFLGIMAFQRKWFLTMSARVGYIYLSIGGLLVAILYFGGNSLGPFLLKGGLYFGSFTRSLIETLLCITLVIGLLVLFREKVNGTNRWTKMLANNVFVVYFIHVLVVVFLQYALNNLPISVWAKFLATVFLGIILSFLLAIFVWRKIPYLKQMM
ncbi:acyltransferase family protein [Sporosarcina highlanderae]|uniref:Acyltransferase family protein n=1 Tax=Sporosarcina highlanderae TaxID=3035916 RepID=A0ABT8JT48_9BACL|nr:acyltransferase family protein [Sporosarcina highlanderae]MDN4608172.1 acyltransferase family protein [Sporosarcina highlanderae]